MDVSQQHATQLEREQATIIRKIRSAEESDPCDVVGRQMLHNWRVQLDKIGHALARCASGEYGICISCHQPIDAERLAALPYADKCVDCQRSKERPAYTDYKNWRNRLQRKEKLSCVM